MKITRHLALLALALGILATGLPAQAEETALLNYELYSWPKGREWQYALFEGTGTVRSAESIKSRRNTLKSTTYLKGRLASLQPRDAVYWRERKKEGLPLPPPDTVRDIQHFLQSIQVFLVMPDQKEPPLLSIPTD